MSKVQRQNSKSKDEERSSKSKANDYPRRLKYSMPNVRYAEVAMEDYPDIIGFYRVDKRDYFTNICARPGANIIEVLWP